MSQEQRAVVIDAYKWGLERGYREMGAHYAVESHGDMRAIRVEADGSICAGPSQNNVERVCIKLYGKRIRTGDYRTAFRTTQDSLCTSLLFSLEASMVHIQIGLYLYKYRWNVWKWYNNIEAESDAYPAKIQAWLKFLDEAVGAK